MNIHALLLVAAMLLVGANVGIGKSIVVFMPVALLALIRFTIAVVVMAPLYRPSVIRRIGRAEWVGLLLQAVFGTFLFTVLMLGGVARTSVVDAGVITSSIPAVAALFSWLFLKEAPQARVLASIVLAVAGVAIVNLAGAGQTPGAASSLAGNAMVLGAVCCEAIYVVLSRRLAQSVGALEICAFTHLFSLLLALPFGVALIAGFDWSSVPPQYWPLILFYSLSASIFSFWLWMKGVKHIAAQAAGVFTAAMPIAAAGYGIVFLDETPTLAHGAALLCVLSGIAIASTGPRARPAPAV